jgi:ribose 5-phosphate isomerase B
MISERDVASLPAGSSLAVSPGSLITPLARQMAMDRSVALQFDGREAPKALSERRVAIGADHGGFSMKESLKASLETWGYQVLDCGTNSTDSVDYPDYAYAVAKHIADGSAWRGVVLDGAGIGSCMTANKVPGVRAAMCYDQATAINSREHNDANLLTLGAGMLGTGQAKSILKTWLETEFAGGRHARRVDKIIQLERRFAQQPMRAD